MLRCFWGVFWEICLFWKILDWEFARREKRLREKVKDVCVKWGENFFECFVRSWVVLWVYCVNFLFCWVIVRIFRRRRRRGRRGRISSLINIVFVLFYDFVWDVLKFNFWLLLFYLGVVIICLWVIRCWICLFCRGCSCTSRRVIFVSFWVSDDWKCILVVYICFVKMFVS